MTTIATASLITAGSDPAAIASDRILVLDFGSQYSQLIARRIRELKVYCELVPGTIEADEIRRLGPRGLDSDPRHLLRHAATGPRPRR